LSDLEALRLELATFSMQKAALAAEKAGDTEVAFKPSDLPQDTWSASAAETLGELQKSHRELIGSELKVQQIRRDAELRQIERLKRKSEIQTIIRGKCAEQLTSLIAQRKRISDLVARASSRSTATPNSSARLWLSNSA
jgi:hypothetical protein